MPREEHRQIRHAPVIDIRVRRPHAPTPRIDRKRAHHVFVHQALQIDAEQAIGAHDLVRAHALIGRHVAHRIGNAQIGRVVAHDMCRALLRRGGEANAERQPPIGPVAMNGRHERRRRHPWRRRKRGLHPRRGRRAGVARADRAHTKAEQAQHDEAVSHTRDAGHKCGANAARDAAMARICLKSA